MSSRFALIFPGQGSQSLGMLAELANEFPELLETFDHASERLGYDLWHLSQKGSEEKINLTEYAQPLLLAAGYAVWRLWSKRCAIPPVFLSGHSLGEYTALVCAEALDFASALKLVIDRGLYMQEAVPAGRGGMVAIVGLPDEKITEICNSAAENQILAIANYNSIGQTVLAGEIEAVERVVKLAQNSGAKLVKLLPVSVPSHCLLMKSAAERLAERLRGVKIFKPKIPVINNVDVCSYDDPELIRDALVRQLYNPVRWVETILLFAKHDVNMLLECGPGKVLTGLNKRIVPGLKTSSLFLPENFIAVLKNIQD